MRSGRYVFLSGLSLGHGLITTLDLLRYEW
jgi:hypothetical protein